MRTLLDRDHDLLGEEAPPSDLVLGMPALLGVFFAVALICAVCFGFGYSSGHGSHLTGQVLSSAAAAPPAVRQQKPSGAAAQPEDGELTSSLQNSGSSTVQAAPVPAVVAPKPLPGSLKPAQDQSLAAIAQPPSTMPVPVAAGRADPEVQAPTHAKAAVMPSPAVTATPAATEGASLNLMVQIAAVTHAADAETLSTALRHDGFSAIVRTTTGDPFFHVQVGPFASREAAKAMRARLAASGYNAFIKQ